MTEDVNNMGALLSFFGGSAFRMVWGELSSWFTAKQDHKHEMEKLELQSKLDQQTFANNIEQIKTQADLGMREIVVKSQADQDVADANSFVEAMKTGNRPTGTKWVDAWNASVRPAYASIALMLWVFQLYEQEWVMAAFDLELFGAIVGFYFADRSLRNRGK